MLDDKLRGGVAGILILSELPPSCSNIVVKLTENIGIFSRSRTSNKVCKLATLPKRVQL